MNALARLYLQVEAIDLGVDPSKERWNLPNLYDNLKTEADPKYF